jgi:hypothetical protein
VAVVTAYADEYERLAMRLGELFDIEWDPEVMTYEEEPHAFRSVSKHEPSKERINAER